MQRVELYTLSTTQLPSNVGDYVMFTRFPAHPRNRLIPLSGTDYNEFEMVEVPAERVACKVYRLCETGKPDRLVAIDPDLVDTIKFFALDKVKAQLADEKFRVDELTAKLSISEHFLDKEKANSSTYELMYNKLLYHTEAIPVWKFVWNRLVNWYTK